MHSQIGLHSVWCFFCLIRNNVNEHLLTIVTKHQHNRFVHVSSIVYAWVTTLTNGGNVVGKCRSRSEGFGSKAQIPNGVQRQRPWSESRREELWSWEHFKQGQEQRGNTRSMIARNPCRMLCYFAIIQLVTRSTQISGYYWHFSWGRG